MVKVKMVYTTASWFFPGAATDCRVAGTGLAGDPTPLQVQHRSSVAGITAPYAPQCCRVIIIIMFIYPSNIGNITVNKYYSKSAFNDNSPFRNKILYCIYTVQTPIYRLHIA
jgi:hypothetical protein